MYSLRKNKEACNISENTRDLMQELMRSSEAFAADEKNSKKTEKVKGTKSSHYRMNVNSVSFSTEIENRKC